MLARLTNIINAPKNRSINANPILSQRGQVKLSQFFQSERNQKVEEIPLIVSKIPKVKRIIFLIFGKLKTFLKKAYQKG